MSTDTERSTPQDVVTVLNQKAQELVEEAKSAVKKRLEDGFWKDMGSTMATTASMFICSIFVFLDAGLDVSRGATASAIEGFCSGAFIVIVGVLLIYVVYQRRRTLAFERIVRLSTWSTK